MKRIVRSALHAVGIDIIRYRPSSGSVSRPSSGSVGRPSSDSVRLPPDVLTQDRAILERVASFTMTSIARQIALVQAVRYLVRQGVEGCFVECGVWRGGSSMAVALTLAQLGETMRDLYLYDTFEGMTPPTGVDRAADGTPAQTYYDRELNETGGWCVAGLDDVRQNMASTGYPQARVHFVKGTVETTIPRHVPNGPVALLRLDTDWYESTKHELIHLFPRVSEGGVLIIDDYGHWEGARKAVDEYLGGLTRTFYVHRIDYSGRLLLKQ
jgi:O-methyltransferase